MNSTSVLVFLTTFRPWKYKSFRFVLLFLQKRRFRKKIRIAFEMKNKYIFQRHVNVLKRGIVEIHFCILLKSNSLYSSLGNRNKNYYLLLNVWLHTKNAMLYNNNTYDITNKGISIIFASKWLRKKKICIVRIDNYIATWQ